MRHRSITRAAWPLLAAILALSSSVAFGANATSAPAPTSPPQPAWARQAQVDGLATAAQAADFTSTADGVPAAIVGQLAQRIESISLPSNAPAKAAPAPSPTVRPTQPATTTTTQLWWLRYQGVNHVWMPTLGINRPVYSYACSRTTVPSNLVYRWGCGGRNNVYLLGHAYGVFKALHDAYDNHTLKKGMPVIYADGSGHERLYRVATWRVVTPSDSAWAIASQPVPSMTLQTCVGANDAYRLLVRLVVATR